MAEARLREATKKADHGELKKFKDERDLQKEKVQLKQQVRDLREMLKGKKHDKDLEKALDELEANIDESDGSSNDEIKAELERLREVIGKLDDKEPEKKASQELTER